MATAAAAVKLVGDSSRHGGWGQCLLRGEEERARPPERATQQRVVFYLLLEASSYGMCYSLLCWVVWRDFLEVS